MSLFLPTLVWWQWLLLALVPPAIVLLYFLKLRRTPVEVPSTYLWHKAIEDLRVNSLWQRLRRSLLLLLQLLLITLVMLALLRPGMRGSQLVGERFILLIDNSASMSATDVESAESRLAEAKRRARRLVDSLRGGQQAWVVSFSKDADTQQDYTDSRQKLLRAIDRIEPTTTTTDISAAFGLAGGRANPDRSGQRDSPEGAVADPVPATLYILSDGGFPKVRDFAMGNLSPQYLPIGREDAPNVGIVAFAPRQSASDSGQWEVFARLENSGPSDTTMKLDLYVDGRLETTEDVTVPARDMEGVEFEVTAESITRLRLEIATEDALKIDNVAYAAVNPPHQVRVLVVTPGNEPLRLALTRPSLTRQANVEFRSAAILPKKLDGEDLTPEQKKYRAEALTGAFDLVIFDRCAPPDMPRANTFFIGSLPPAAGKNAGGSRSPGDWQSGPLRPAPQIVYVAPHPIMRNIKLRNLSIAEGRRIIPPGGRTLIEARFGKGEFGALCGIADRGFFRDMVLGMEIIGQADDGELVPNTDLPRRLGFPLLMDQIVGHLAVGPRRGRAETLQPGEQKSISLPPGQDRVTVESPGGMKATIEARGQSTVIFSDTGQPGVYSVRDAEDGTVLERFAVNLFDSMESDIRPREKVYSGYEEFRGQTSTQPVRWDWWKWLLLFALGVLLIEWYVFSRRVRV